MGNQLVGIAPSQIFPVEHYLTDQGDLKFDTRQRKKINIIMQKYFNLINLIAAWGLRDF